MRRRGVAVQKMRDCVPPNAATSSVSTAEDALPDFVIVSVDSPATVVRQETIFLA